MNRTSKFVFTLAGITVGVLLVIWLKMEHPQRIQVKLPDGATINAELSASTAELHRGLQDRESLNRNAGMLFQYPSVGQHQHWMYQCRIPLDMIWLDTQGTILEVVKHAQPCLGPAKTCAGYGATHKAKYVLELAAGESGAHRLAIGQTITFRR